MVNKNENDGLNLSIVNAFFLTPIVTFVILKQKYMTHNFILGTLLLPISL
ncbi:MAG: hypothetical protein RLZZ292_2968, partial [Bacteroidota bacterium]